MAAPFVIPPLPLSQWIVAWALRALGYGNTPGPGVSRGTLRRAQAGDPIPEAWDDLVASMLRRLGAKSLPEDLRTTAGALLRQWDLMVGELPSASGLSLAERLHAPLVCAIPAVGIHLGALATSVALATRTPIMDWSWNVEPLDERFFGKVIRALFDRRFPGKTNEERKRLVEVGIEDEEKSIDWRTIERWYYGETEVPNVKSLVALAEVLGKGAEAMLRAARLTAVLREDLSAWIGADAMAEWAGVVGGVGRVTAQLLSDPGEVASLLRQIREDLEAPHGDAFHANLRSLLPGEAKEAPRSELIALMAAAAERIETDVSVDHPVARWIIGCNILLVYPQLEVRVWSMLGGNPLGYLATKNISGHIHRDWTFRTLMKDINHGGTLSFTRADRSPVERQISSAMQEIARRWETTSLRFRQFDDDDDPTLDDDIKFVLFELFGTEGLVEANHGVPPSFDLFGMVLDPTVEIGLPDDQVRASLPLSLARARRLLKGCDWDGAMRWLPDLRTLRPPLSEAVIAGLLATYAESPTTYSTCKADCCGLFRAAPVGSDRNQARGALLDAAQLVEKLVEQILQIGKAPEASQTLLETLVHALPVAIRVMLLREELEAVQEGLNSEPVGRLVEQLKRCLELHATHGHGWALLALWCRLHEQRKEESTRKSRPHTSARAGSSKM